VDGRTLSVQVSGDGIELLDHEAGGHRLQRVPVGEKRGRVHSSTVTVCVLFDGVPLAHPAARRAFEDFELSWFSGSGAGGQHRNKHQNSARLKHRPTGIIVTAQCRKRPQSEAQARAEMAARLDSLCLSAGAVQTNAVRAAQIGTGERKRRTYRFQDGLVSDHLTGRVARIDEVLRGRMDLLWPLQA
jgi:peptide chain release factor 1